MLPITDTLPRPPTIADSRRRTAAAIFRGALAFNAAVTVFWLVTFLGGGSYFFQDYRVDWQTVGRILVGVLVFYVVWGIIWWAVKAALLRFFVGFTKDERRDAFSSRMDRPYDVAGLVSRYSERRIRIADMIGRRGRFMTLAAAGFYHLYVQVARDYDADFASAFFQDNLLDGVITSWIFCVWVVTAHGLGTPWLVLSLVLAISNSVFELLSPRGTDDFTMATANALICWAFGVWLR